MIVQGDFEGLRCAVQTFGHFPVGLRGAGVAAGMVVCYDDTRGFFPKGEFQDHPGIDSALIHRACSEFPKGEQGVAGTEEQGHHELIPSSAEMKTQVVFDGGSVGEGLGLEALFGEAYGGNFANNRKNQGAAFAHARKGGELTGTRLQNGPDGSEMPDQFLGQGFHILAGQGIAQEEFENFIVQKAREASLGKTLEKTLPVALQGVLLLRIHDIPFR